VNLPLPALRKSPTVAVMAFVITQHKASQADPNLICHLMAEVEALTEFKS
jgi:hypothetical protein